MPEFCYKTHTHLDLKKIIHKPDFIRSRLSKRYFYEKLICMSYRLKRTRHNWCIFCFEKFKTCTFYCIYNPNFTQSIRVAIIWYYMVFKEKLLYFSQVGPNKINLRRLKPKPSLCWNFVIKPIPTPSLKKFSHKSDFIRTCLSIWYFYENLICIRYRLERIRPTVAYFVLRNLKPAPFIVYITWTQLWNLT